MTDFTLPPPPSESIPAQPGSSKALRLAVKIWLILLIVAIFLSAGLFFMSAAAVVILFNTPVVYGIVDSSKVVRYDGTPYYEASVSLPDRRGISVTYAMNLIEYKPGDSIPVRPSRETGRVDSITELYELPRTAKHLLVIVPVTWLTLWLLKRYRKQLQPLDTLWFKVSIYVAIGISFLLFVSMVKDFFATKNSIGFTAIPRQTDTRSRQ